MASFIAQPAHSVFCSGRPKRRRSSKVPLVPTTAPASATGEGRFCSFPEQAGRRHRRSWCYTKQSRPLHVRFECKPTSGVPGKKSTGRSLVGIAFCIFKYRRIGQPCCLSACTFLLMAQRANVAPAKWCSYLRVSLSRTWLPFMPVPSPITKLRTCLYPKEAFEDTLKDDY